MPGKLERLPSPAPLAEKATGSGGLSTVSTESAVTAFNLTAGFSIAAAQILAARRLSKVNRQTISLTRLAIPGLVMLGGGIAAAVLVPSS